MAKPVERAVAAKVFQAQSAGGNVPREVRASARKVLEGTGSAADVQACRDYLGIKKSGATDLRNATQGISGAAAKIGQIGFLGSQFLSGGPGSAFAGVQLSQVLSKEAEKYFKSPAFKQSIEKAAITQAVAAMKAGGKLSEKLEGLADKVATGTASTKEKNRLTRALTKAGEFDPAAVAGKGYGFARAARGAGAVLGTVALVAEGLSASDGFYTQLGESGLGTVASVLAAVQAPTLIPLTWGAYDNKPNSAALRSLEWQKQRLGSSSTARRHKMAIDDEIYMEQERRGGLVAKLTNFAKGARDINEMIHRAEELGADEAGVHRSAIGKTSPLAEKDYYDENYSNAVTKNLAKAWDWTREAVGMPDKEVKKDQSRYKKVRFAEAGERLSRMEDAVDRADFHAMEKLKREAEAIAPGSVPKCWSSPMTMWFDQDAAKTSRRIYAQTQSPTPPLRIGQ